MRTLKETEDHCPMYNVFFISGIFFNKYLYFSYNLAGYLLDRPCIFNNILITRYGATWVQDLLG